jgi:hypothetical protein
MRKKNNTSLRNRDLAKETFQCTEKFMSEQISTKLREYLGVGSCSSNWCKAGLFSSFVVLDGFSIPRSEPPPVSRGSKYDQQNVPPGSSSRVDEAPMKATEPQICLTEYAVF